MVPSLIYFSMSLYAVRQSLWFWGIATAGGKSNTVVRDHIGFRIRDCCVGQLYWTVTTMRSTPWSAFFCCSHRFTSSFCPQVWCITYHSYDLYATSQPNDLGGLAKWTQDPATSISGTNFFAWNYYVGQHSSSLIIITISGTVPTLSTPIISVEPALQKPSI